MSLKERNASNIVSFIKTKGSIKGSSIEEIVNFFVKEAHINANSAKLELDNLLETGLLLQKPLLIKDENTPSLSNLTSNGIEITFGDLYSTRNIFAIL